MVKYSYMEFLLIAIDQLFNALCGGSPDETLSARCWRKREREPWKAFRVCIDYIFFWQKEHCKFAWQSEMKRLQLPSIYQNTGK